MTATLLCPELIAPVANMLAAAWAAGGIDAPTQPVRDTAPVGALPAAEEEGVGRDEGPEQGDRGAPGQGGGDLCAPVDAGPGPRPRRVDRPSVRPGRGSGPAGVARQRHRGDRRRPGDLRTFDGGPRRVQGPAR